MISTHFKFIFGICILGLCFRCANIRPIQGGAEDKSAPKILKESSTANETRNFKDKVIKLSFDEWISLNNPSQNIIITPTLQYPFKTKLKSKSLIIEFDSKEVLQENTTYSVFLGETVQDITNRNISKNIRYIFSTGPDLDSFYVRGSIVDAYQGKVLSKTLVMLYNTLDDSSFRKKRPNYFTYAEDNGNFKIDYLKPGVYQVYGLIDKNQNYYYDQSSETIAFSSNPITVATQDTQQVIRLFLSREAGKNFILDKKAGIGKLRVQFSNNSENCSIQCDECETKQFLREKDSLVMWYTSPTEVLTYVKYENKIDTIKLKPYTLPTINKGYNITNFSNLLLPSGEFELVWTEPILKVDSSKIIISPVQSYQYRIDSIDKRKLFIHFNTQNIKRVQINFDSMAIVGIHNSVNREDSLKVNFYEQSTLSRLKIKIDSLIPDQQYIYQIVNGDKILEERIFIPGSTNTELYFNTLYPGKYRSRLIEDSNKNKVWDPGLLKNRIQAERVWNWDLIELRADWDLEQSLKAVL